VHCSEQLNYLDYVLFCVDVLKLTRDNDIKPECFMNLWFLPRDAVLMQYMLLPCLSVRPSQASIVPKWLNLGSHKQRHTISSDCSFLAPKILRKFEWGHPHLGAKYRCGRFISFIFDHCLAICQKRCKMGTWLQWIGTCICSYALSNGAVSSDLEWPLSTQATPVSTFCIPFNIFVTSGVW